MRTRFLCTHHLSSAPFQNFDFLRLPLPQLPALNLPKFEDLNCLEGVTTLTTRSSIQKFPIEEALSRFFAHVFPHTIDVDVAVFTDSQILSGKPDFDCRSKQANEPTPSDNVVPGKGNGNHEMIQFEVPELDPSFLSLLEDIPYFAKENMLIQISYDENKLEVPTLEVRMHLDTLQSIYSVDDICSPSFVEKSSVLMEESGIIEGQCHSSTGVFPLLEVDGTSLGTANGKSVHMKVLIFENVELQCLPPEAEGMGNRNELLDSTKFDTSQHLSDGCLAMGCAEVEFPCLNFSSEMDLISIIELQKKSGNLAGSVYFGSPITFDELQLFNSDLYSFSEYLSEAKVSVDKNTCELMVRRAENFRTFDELVVSHELIPVDNSFRSLPIPPVSENGNIRPLDLYIKEILIELEPESSSMSDGLYLDWHFLEDDKCKVREGLFNLLGKADANNIDLCTTFSDNGIFVSDFLFSSDSPQEPNKVESKELILPSSAIPISPVPCSIDVSTKLLNDRKFSTEGVSPRSSAKKAFSLVIDGRGKDFKPADCSTDANAMDQSSILFSATTSVLPKQWNIKVHQIFLSSDILLVIDDLRKIFLDICESRRELIELWDPSQAVDDITILRIPKKELINFIKKRSVCRSSMFEDGDNIMSLVTLCAIKQMVWYLCYYGLHTSYLFIERLYRSMQGLGAKLDFLYNFIEDVHQKGERDEHKFHPSLSVIKDMLQTYVSKGSPKMLIVAEPVFWWSLKKLLTSMNIALSQPQNGQKDDFYKLTDASLQIIHESDCCLVTHELLFSSFPFDKFEIILEYGGSQRSSKVSSISPKSDTVPSLHFLKVEIEDLSIPKALCDGVDMPENNESRMEGGPHSFSTLNEIENTIEEMLNFLPVGRKLSGESMDELQGNEACSPAAEHAEFSLRSEQHHGSIVGSPETIVIVNTHNFDEKMVISRRRTYQKILAFQKKGVQVVERDLCQPVDIVISASACFAWYDCKNIAKKSTAPNEAFSCLPLCVENIAANILTSLSFAFSGCILVFEGETNFITGIMESSDELYAAAASLGLDIQVFYSYSSEMTDEIIVSCVEQSLRTSRGLYPRMPESQTLAEHFLTAFPLINPLSAHAILSSGGSLAEFLGGSHKCRIQAVQKYQVPEESITLLSALTRFGEREDSKSGMTDCSSSVSSAPDSESLHSKSNSGGKKRKTTWDIEDLSMPTNELFEFDPPRPFSKGTQNHPAESDLHDSWISEDLNLSGEFGNSSLSFDKESCFQKESLDTYLTKDPFKVTEFCDYQMRKDPQMRGQLNKLEASQNDVCFHPRQRVDLGMMNEMDRQTWDSGEFTEDTTGELIDIDDTVVTRKAFHNAKYMSFSTLENEMERPTMVFPKTARKLFSGASGLPNFPTTAEIDSSSYACTSVRDLGQGMGQHLSGRKKILIKHHKGGVLGKGASQGVKRFSGLKMQENNTAGYGETPLSSALQSSLLPQGSPWTVDFLNRIREKSLSRQQFLPHSLSAPCYEYPGKSSKVTKRKSPSLLELFKYHGNSCQKAATRRERPTECIQQLPASTAENASGHLITEWTPTDKRAKQELSFTRNGGQTKLVWSDKSSNTWGGRY